MPVVTRLVFLAAILTGATASAEPKPAPGPVLVELFTSQGCSSCPPADKVLSQLARAGRVSGRDVVALSFHVDYWDDLGWKDPWSQAAWTERQRAYARRLPAGSSYTPQLVIAGQRHVVGSRGKEARAAIAAAPPQARVDATLLRKGQVLTVHAVAPPRAEVWAALWQDGLSTRVVRGENAGATLVNDRVVRVLRRVAAAGRTGSVEIELDPTWKSAGVVVFAQDSSLAIRAATALAVP
jgi:hypothetical protein